MPDHAFLSKREVLGEKTDARFVMTGSAGNQQRRTQAMALSDVKALTFDVFGTVVNWRDSIAREAKAFLGPKGYDKDWHSFADRWRARYQPAMEKVRKGERPWARLDDLHRENLVELLKEFEIGGLEEGDIDHLNRAW